MLVTATKIVIYVRAGLRAGRSGVRMLAEVRDLSRTSIMALEHPPPPKPPIQLVSGFLPRKKGGQAVMFTTNFYLAPRLRMRGGAPLLPHVPSWPL